MSKSKSKSAKYTGQAAFTYTSVCCSKMARKPPVQRSPQDFKENTFSECGLGVWRCDSCGQKCKVKRASVKNTPEPGQ